MINQSIERRFRLCSLLVFIGVVVVALLTIDDYGMSWDEEFRFSGGDTKLSYYSALLNDESVEPPSDSYPGLFDLSLAIFHDLVPDLGSRSIKGHYLSLFFGLLGMLSVWRIAAQLGGERAGFWSLLLIICLPRFYGHMFFNPKDIPLAGTYAFGLWALVSLLSYLPSVKWRYVVWLGIAAGLAMSTRIAGFLILVYYGAIIGVFLCLRYLQSRDLGGFVRGLGAWAVRGASSGVIAFLILFVFWPALHQNPFSNTVQAVNTVESYGWSGMVLMGGYFWEAQELPFYYLLYWLFKALPELLLVLVGSALIAGFFQLRQRILLKEQLIEGRFYSLLAVPLSAFFPIIYILWKDPVLYDGIRHVLFVFPPLVCFSALGFEWYLRKLEVKIGIIGAATLQFVAGLLLAVVVVDMIRLHPYQYIYFNKVSGGLEGAFNRDETDYWGLSHKEAAEWLNENGNLIVETGEAPVRVFVPYSDWMLEEFLSVGDFLMVDTVLDADLIVSITRFNLHQGFENTELIHQVRRSGIPLCVILRVNKE